MEEQTIPLNEYKMQCINGHNYQCIDIELYKGKKQCPECGSYMTGIVAARWLTDGEKALYKQSEKTCEKTDQV